MDNPKRSLIEALQTSELPGEALKLIEEGRPKPVKAAGARMAIPLAAAERGGRPLMEMDDPSTPAAPSLRGTVNLSVRIDSRLTDALLRVAFERKLQRKTPFTQREIVAEALLLWLEKEEKFQLEFEG